MRITLSFRDYLFIIGSVVYLGLGLFWDNPLFNILFNWLILFAGARLFFDWLSRDADSRGMDARLWQFLVFLTLPFGFIAYLYLRKPKQYRHQEII
jgi:uncharacterized membrane protein YfcA